MSGGCSTAGDVRSLSGRADVAFPVPPGSAVRPDPVDVAGVTEAAAGGVFGRSSGSLLVTVSPLTKLTGRRAAAPGRWAAPPARWLRAPGYPPAPPGGESVPSARNPSPRPY